MYDYLPDLRDSIETSISMKIFKTIYDAFFAHIYKSKLIKFPLSKINQLNNFDKIRLQKSAIKAYPSYNRPRGNKDIKSIQKFQKILRENKNTEPIWILINNDKYILLDGAHRIVANYIEKKSYIYAFLITI